MLSSYPDLSDGAYFEPTSDNDLSIALDLLALAPTDRVADLGAGDGQVVVSMAQFGAIVCGFEKDEELVKLAQANINEADLCLNAYIKHANFWEQSLTPFNKIYIFQYYTIMDRLEEKLLAELLPGSQVVSNHWVFPSWPHKKQVGDIYLYAKS